LRRVVGVRALAARVVPSPRLATTTRDDRKRHAAYTSAPSTTTKIRSAIAPTTSPSEAIASAGGLTYSERTGGSDERKRWPEQTTARHRRRAVGLGTERHATGVAGRLRTRV